MGLVTNELIKIPPLVVVSLDFKLHFLKTVK